ncbi:MAG: Gfo/Idh/MocA family protein [Planctomycetota bacterium]
MLKKEVDEMVDEKKKGDGEAGKGGLTRRDFIKAGAAAGAGLAVSQMGFVRDVHAADDINIALVGTGRQGRVLMMSMLRIPGVRFKAVCDIWKYSQRYSSRILKKFKQPVNVYEDYREMLEAETDIDAVVNATPDWMHAPITIAALKAGKHVYCEKEMSNSLEMCRKMVETSSQTGKLLQIGHQRRSNPRYKRAYNGITKKNLLGRITHCYGQWNRPKRLEQNIPPEWAIDDAALKKYGYDTMERFRDWRWYKEYSGGAIADLGSHQIDIFSWFLGCDPASVIASGGLDYYKDKEWYDNVMAIYEYQTAKGPARAFYQVLNTTSYGGYYEVFMGDKGSFQISENAKIGFFFPEVTKEQPKWVDETEKIDQMDTKAIALKVGHSKRKAGGKRSADDLQAEADAKKPVHQPHLENFFNAIRGKAKLNCPGEIGYQTALPVLSTNDAVASGKKITFTKDQYEV